MSTTIPHSLAPVGHVHAIVNWVFATFSDMTAYTGVVGTDLHKVAYVAEVAFQGYYTPVHVDVGTGAVTWRAVGSSGSVAPTAFADLTDTPASYTGAANHKVVVNAGATGLIFIPDTGGSGTTDLAYIAAPANGTITSSTGTSATVTLAGGVNSGLMSPTHYSKLEGINLSLYAPLASPTFTGTATLPGTTSIGSVTAAQLSYLGDVTSAIQAQFSGKQATLVSGTNIKTINGVTLLGAGDLVVSGGATNLTYTASATQGVVVSSTGTDATIPAADGTNAGLMVPAQFTKLAGIDLSLYALLASPTFTGTVTLPSTTSIGTVSSTELGYLTNVTSDIQSQFSGKQDTLVSGTNIKTVNGSTLLGSGDLAISGGATNITHSTTATTVTVESSTGTDAVIPAAGGGNAGIMTDAMASKLAGIEIGATAGNATITLSGDVTGSGTTSITATIANDAVTFSKMQNVATAKLLGRGSASTGDVEEITLGTNLSFTGTTLNATGGGGAPVEGEDYIGFTDCLNTSTDLAPFLGAAFSNGTIAQVATRAICVDHPGVVSINSGTNNNSGYRLYSLDTILEGGEQFDCLFRQPANPVGGGTYSSRIGWFSASTPTVGLSTGACLKLVGTAVVAETAALGTRTEHGTGYTLTEDLWYHARVSVAFDGDSIRFELFLLDATSVWDVTISTNLPTKANTSGMAASYSGINSPGGAGILAYVDIMRLFIPVSGHRGNF